MLILTSENAMESAINGSAYCSMFNIKTLTCETKNIEKLGSH